MRGKGSSGGHNGLTHIQQTLNTEVYPRIRFGVGSDFAKGRQVDYVLGEFSTEEKKDLPLLIDKTVDGVIAFTSIGLDRAMNTFNSK